MNNKKVIVIGIDGGTFDVILPMIKQGELPVLSSLMNTGAWGDLQSTIPPDTGPAWVSMMTGVNPGKHGIFFFQGDLHNNYRGGRTLGSQDIRFPPLWSILSKNKKEVVFVNVPFTYPPMEVNGVMISGMLVPPNAEVVSFPSNIYSDIVKKIGRYEIDDWDPKVVGADLGNIHLYYNKIAEAVSRMTEERKKATLLLLKENRWDFAMVVFTSIDRLQHVFWKSLNHTGDGRKNEPFSQYSKVIYEGYKQIDRAVGEILETAGKDCTVIISSDHGFGPLNKDFFVNKWLEKIGLLKTRKDVRSKKIILTMPTLYKIVSKLIPGIHVPDWAKKIAIPIPRIIARDMDELIDWQKTQAYLNECGININLRGREPHGIVKTEKDASDLLTFIQEQFRELRDESEPNGKIADWITRKEEIYRGPFVKEAADLYFSVNNRSYLQNTRIDGEEMFGNCSVSGGTGMHRENGIFIMSGPFCRKNNTFKPRIIDISPTILYLMGLPMLEEMDGRVLEEVIEPSYLKSHPIKRVESWSHGGKSDPYSQEDEESIRNSLKGLGYLS